jgi:anti-sigma B factor antagonist
MSECPASFTSVSTSSLSTSGSHPSPSSDHVLVLREGGMSVAVSSTGSKAVVTVQGEVDIGTADRLEAAYRHAATVGVVVVDLSDVTFMDSSGLNALVRARAATRPEWHVCGLRPRLADLFRITGLDQVFVLHAELADVLPWSGPPDSAPSRADGAQA